MKPANNAFRWLPCPVVFICTAHEGHRDIMTATAMFISEKEPLLTVSVEAGHLTDRLISASGQFIVAIASVDQKKLAFQLGALRGEDIDKYARFSIDTLPPTGGDSLVPARVSAWMKCTVERTETITGYRVITGRIVESGDLENPPLIWQRDALWQLTAIPE